jgi:DNA polymerase III subunit epsilon
MSAPTGWQMPASKICWPERKPKAPEARVRQVILDTETTGLEPAQGHRVLELAAVEVCNRRLSGNRFHRYLNPERDSDAAALQVHGLTREFLADKPKFAQVANEFLDFIQGAELVIHNAPFDVAFLNAELARLDRGHVEQHCAGVTDTLRMAKDLHPGKRNGLDALCERYGVDNSMRTLHGALLDAELLAEVYLAMTRGQESLIIDMAPAPRADSARAPRVRRALVVLRASAAESEQHVLQLGAIDKASKGNCVWLRISAA